MVLPIETPICGPRWLLNVTLGNVCFEAHYGLKSDIALSPKSAKLRHPPTPPMCYPARAKRRHVLSNREGHDETA
jgi:hypothetical protein